MGLGMHEGGGIGLDSRIAVVENGIEAAALGLIKKTSVCLVTGHCHAR